MKYLTFIITVPLSIFAVLFAVSNDAEVQLSLWPFENTYKTGVNVFGMGFLGLGFFLGALFVWILNQKMRFKYWKETRKTARLEKELDALNTRPTVTPSPESVPPLAQAPLLASK
ncbi:MAG: hypothetical protein PW788_05465 [Micavibrio sp.]|nr:hypothetical protein [Micavibrio sp.]